MAAKTWLITGASRGFGRVWTEAAPKNLLGPLWVTQAALSVLRGQGHGHIIQVSSVGQHAGQRLGAAIRTRPARRYWRSPTPRNRRCASSSATSRCRCCARNTPGGSPNGRPGMNSPAGRSAEVRRLYHEA